MIKGMGRMEAEDKEMATMTMRTRTMMAMMMGL
jgi:hypothetical protein